MDRICDKIVAYSVSIPITVLGGLQPGDGRRPHPAAVVSIPITVLGGLQRDLSLFDRLVDLVVSIPITVLGGLQRDCFS